MTSLMIVLVRPEGPHNVGSVARLCGNFGATLRLVDEQCDTRSSDAMKMAHPCQRALEAAARYADLPSALADAAFSIATSGKIAPAVLAPPLHVARARLLLPTAPERLALVFGNERTGLSKEEAAACDRVVRLATPGDVESFNLASAVAVTLTLFAEAALAEAPTRATRAARDELALAWSDALERAGFYRATTRAAFAPRLEELLDKMDLSERDVELVQQMLARMVPR